MPAAKDPAVLEAGVNVQVAKNVRLKLYYQGRLADGVREHGVMANVKVRF